MGIFSSIYSMRKPRGFSYSPRYYNPEKEKREERIQRILQEVDKEQGKTTDSVQYIPHIRGQFKAKKDARSRIVHKQNVRIILIFIVLLYFAYLFITRI
ncbi:MAG TPA: hypothetical protein P5243_03645 [Bacteroidales bacterium]|nr:hypothetical protein [Bacteroidales bacterium]HRS18574.1 hypothetical protein [Bacteroidales bacterium]